ncbi:OmpA/MotB family protein [Desulfovibrio inopinatus]|uniref:OmpA/MotB family protein n=1 Tax=Desulfovibrio inopinatus TaxID=102109 RepID=UPI00042782C2|nr:OmpA family protein [Desulfovibrio inopinatus]
MKTPTSKFIIAFALLIPLCASLYLGWRVLEKSGQDEVIEDYYKRLFDSSQKEDASCPPATTCENDQLDAGYQTLVSDLEGEVAAKEVTIEKFKEMLSINVVDEILFDTGRAIITPRGKIVLAKVGGVIGKMTDKHIYIVGHTDDVPIQTFRYPSNWELSCARAAAVIRYLLDTDNLDPAMFSAVGRSSYQPVSENDTPEGRARNRRVEIVIANFSKF